MTSCCGKERVFGASPGLWTSFHSALTLPTGWMLWLTGSELEMRRGWLVISARTCGVYLQRFWSSVTEVEGAAQLAAGSPDLTQTKVLRRVWLAFTTNSS